jgi:hypothetical protein
MYSKMLFWQQLVPSRATIDVSSARFRFSRTHSANGREKRELMHALANKPDRHTITENTSFSELFGVKQRVYHTREVTGSSPVSPIVVSHAERKTIMYTINFGRRGLIRTTV